MFQIYFILFFSPILSLNLNLDYILFLFFLIHILILNFYYFIYLFIYYYYYYILYFFIFFLSPLSSHLPPRLQLPLLSPLPHVICLLFFFFFFFSSSFSPHFFLLFIFPTVHPTSSTHQAQPHALPPPFSHFLFLFFLSLSFLFTSPLPLPRANDVTSAPFLGTQHRRHFWCAPHLSLFHLHFHFHFYFIFFSRHTIPTYHGLQTKCVGLSYTLFYFILF